MLLKNRNNMQTKDVRSQSGSMAFMKSIQALGKSAKSNMKIISKVTSMEKE
jgi:hypothetical protein